MPPGPIGTGGFSVSNKTVTSTWRFGYKSFVLILDSPVRQGEVVKASYISGPVVDGQGNELTDFSMVSVTNDSELVSESEGGDDEIMIVDETIIVNVTSTWGDGIDGPVTVDLQPLEGDLFYSVGTSAPLGSIRGKFIKNEHTKTVTIQSGKTLFYRSRSGTGILAYDLKNN
jgi:hypothetical protein